VVEEVEKHIMFGECKLPISQCSDVPYREAKEITLSVNKKDPFEYGV